MKMFRRIVMFCLLSVCALSLHAQIDIHSTWNYSYATVTGTGQVGSYLMSSTHYPASAFTFDWNVTGTTPSVCTFQIEGSSDGSHWYALTDSTSCTTGSMMHIAYKPVLFTRVNVLTYTAGDGTTRVFFNYTRGE